MNAKELLLECKVRLKLESDYALAKKLDIPRARMSEYMNGKVNPDVYALTRIALTLGRDPIRLIAEYEAATEKNEVKKTFWQGFISRASKAGKAGTLALIFISSLLTGLNADKPRGLKSA
jgi:transcriptional regulator with XRE-family HTH domain